MEQFGSIIIRVFTGADQQPVAGATVAVTKTSPAGELSLLGLRVTGASGEVLPVDLPAPDIAESTAPETGPDFVQPWSSCDITADHPDYERVEVLDVQIFAGVTSLLPLALIPRSEDTRERTQIFRVEPQTL